MFISWPSSEGLQITVLSVKEGCKLWLQQGVPYIFSERFCHDDLENYFGKQRAIGRKSDNPTVHDFGYNDNTVKNQFSVRGNLTLKEMCKVLQKNLMKYVMNFCRNEENERSLVVLAVGRVRDY